MKRSVTLFGTAAALAFLLPGAVLAQDEDPNRHTGWEVSVFAGGLDDSPEFAEPAEGEAVFDPENEWMFGGFLGYSWASGFFLEGEVATQEAFLRLDADTNEELRMTLFGVDVGSGIPIGTRFLAFADVGAGFTRWSPESVDSESDFSLSYGVGGKLYLTDNVAFRVDAKLRHVPGALAESFQALGGTDPDETFWGSSVTFGLNVKFGGGGPGDSDGDGVTDDVDRCPNTPAGVEVDAVGCPFDSDGDGVYDYMDDCPNTPRGTEVDSRGCPVERPAPPRETPPTERRDDPVTPAPQPVTFDPIYFGFDSDVLDAEAQGRLDRIGRVLSERADDPIEIRGHTDLVGTDAYNDALSRRRAEAAREYLRANFPALSSADFTIRAFGFGQPAVNTRDQERRNRRVIVYVGVR